MARSSGSGSKAFFFCSIVLSNVLLRSIGSSDPDTPKIAFNVSAGIVTLPPFVVVPALSAVLSAAISSAKALSNVLALAPLAALIFPISSPRSEPVLAYAEPAALAASSARSLLSFNSSFNLVVSVVPPVVAA